ncbi:MAG TPA: hypothetical protein VIY73_28165, partial [Polyangiaceae bacterium]
MRIVAFFQRAVLVTLALPVGACGGSTSTSTTDGGLLDSGGTDAGKLPTTPCGWTAGSRSSCDWLLQFTGDPTSCAGFSGPGTASQCLAVCGLSDDNQAPISCSEYSDSSDAGTNTVDCFWCTLNGGRRPAYFASLGFGPPLPGREVGSHFARAACMEAGSVDA